MEDKCCDRTKHREAKEYKDLVNRLNRIEGQVRGIRKMVEEGTLLCGYFNTSFGHTVRIEQF